MDKDLLRIVIIAIGVVVVIAMILWSIFKTNRRSRKIDFYDSGNPLDNIDQSLVLDTSNDEFDIVPLGSALDNDPISVASANEESAVQATASIEVPDIIQFSIVAKTDEGFNGIELVSEFEKLGLEYGNMKVFERLDEQRRVDFAVASMVEPGTFPDTNLESFVSPGIAFFLQPKELDNPLVIYDEFIETFSILVENLDGLALDHNRQPLTDDTVQQYREVLATL